MLSSRIRGAPAASASSTSASVRHSTSSGSPGASRSARAHRLADPAGERRVVLLDQDRVVQPGAVVGRRRRRRPPPSRARAAPASSCACRGSAPRFPRPPRTQRAASVATPDSRWRKLSAVRSARQQRAAPSPRSRSTGPRSRHPPSSTSRSTIGVGIQRPERLLGGVEPEHHAGRLLGDQRARARVGGHGRRSRHVARADILDQGTCDGVLRSGVEHLITVHTRHHRYMGRGYGPGAGG